MLAEIFMVRLETAARLLRDTLPSSPSRFVSFNPNGQVTFKDGRNGSSEVAPEQPVTARVQ
jgi:hypothetical protein